MSAMKKTPVEKLLYPLSEFLKNQTTGGILLFCAAIIAMIWANSPFSESYHHLWETKISLGVGTFELNESLHYWINDGLMAMFFFVVGLELKREMISGELSSLKNSVLPISAAIGGMLIPALVYVAINYNGQMDGWGIPMATDIAFALGIIALLGKRVPLSIKIFLTALAIADDIGAVLVIAFFYTSDISFMNLMAGGVFLAILTTANLAGVRTPWFYGVVGIGGVWLFFLLSGVHATIAGVLAALTIPARTRIPRIYFIRSLGRLRLKYLRARNEENNSMITEDQLHVLQKISRSTKDAQTPLQRMESRFYPIVTFSILPLFALSNAGVELGSNFFAGLTNPVTLGVGLGLIVGKFLGISLICHLMVALKWAKLPVGSTWMHLYGVAMLAGVGFTMSLFITELAFGGNEASIQASKIGILIASVLAGLIGYYILKKLAPPAHDPSEVRKFEE